MNQLTVLKLQPPPPFFSFSKYYFQILIRQQLADRENTQSRKCIKPAGVMGVAGGGARN